MKYFKPAYADREISRVALGCMRIGNMTDKEVDSHIMNAYECGINFFDNADLYGNGHCEEVFGGVLKRNPSLREKIVIQTKCGIRKDAAHDMYDFSKEHILSAVDASLKRLGIDRIDVLLLHRPDVLMDPDEVAEALDELEGAGKVSHFGVSNHDPMQIELLKKSVKQRICVNQLQLSIAHAYMLSSGTSVNMTCPDGTVRDGYVRDYCRLNDITIQPWSPMQVGFFTGSFTANEKYEKLNKTIAEIGEKYNLTDTGVAIAWLLRLPDKMQPIIGTTNPARVKAACDAADVTISAEDWYKIYVDAGYNLP